MKKIQASERQGADYGWLKTYYLFSFADYFDPTNLQFGVLRVFNDDTIAPHSGFDTHGHANMEIVTLVFRGVLTHTDSLGHESHLQAGEVQWMSAGTGVFHAEQNKGDEPVELYQLWFLPTKKETPPHYAQRRIDSFRRQNALTPIVSSDSRTAPLAMGSEATIFLGLLEKGKELSYDSRPDRGVFVYVRKGSVLIQGTMFAAGDQARIQEEGSIFLKGEASCEFLLIDVALEI